ncbi:MAG: hypothetical protein PHW69_07490 [Elusimicrobiaceae bacterium]|nr:hypothetical protein [Elusimicrobiaceae bacterium]
MTRAAASPEPKALPLDCAAARLIETPAFAHGPESDGLFVRAMRESARLHYDNCPEFRGIWNAAGWTPETLCGIRSIAAMPFIYVAAFKERNLASVPPEKVELELTSSGTTGQRSRILLDKISLLRVRRIAWQVCAALGLADLSVTADALCFTFDPARADSLGTAFTDQLLTGLTRRGEIYYALQWDDETAAFRYNMDGCIAAVKRMEKSGRPARLMGFPAHAMMLCEEFEKREGRRIRLHPASWALTGGGWKDRQDRAVDKQEMRARLARGLGLKTERVRDMFGMVEHGVPYMDCPHGKFHVPVYGRVLARDPGTLKVLPWGKKGLLQFVTPYLTSYPSVSLLSADWGSVEKSCSCGLPGSVMTVAGRAGVKKLKGCAISAASVL